MAVYDIIKDIAKVAKNAGNIEIFNSLLDVQQQALDLQQENVKLKQQLEELQNIKELENRVVRHEYTIITLKDDGSDIRYCSSCWDKDRKLVQIIVSRPSINGIESSSSKVKCPICENAFWTGRNVRW